MTGYAIMTFYLPVHYFLHRLAPSSPAPPINALSPSELDYEFVKTALREWPVRNWVGYVGLTLAVALHASEGAHLMLRNLMTGMKKQWKGWSRKTHRTVALLGVLPVLTGLVVIAREPVMAFAMNVERHKAVFLQSPLYKY